MSSPWRAPSIPTPASWSTPQCELRWSRAGCRKLAAVGQGRHADFVVEDARESCCIGEAAGSGDALDAVRGADEHFPGALQTLGDEVLRTAPEKDRPPTCHAPMRSDIWGAASCFAAAAA